MSEFENNNVWPAIESVVEGYPLDKPAKERSIEKEYNMTVDYINQPVFESEALYGIANGF